MSPPSDMPTTSARLGRERADRDLERDRVLGGPVRVVVAVRRVPVAGQVERDERPVERERDGVPGVRVLRAAVDQHQLGFTVAPDERADLLAAAHVDRDPSRPCGSPRHGMSNSAAFSRNRPNSS